MSLLLIFSVVMGYGTGFENAVVTLNRDSKNQRNQGT